MWGQDGNRRGGGAAPRQFSNWRGAADALWIHISIFTVVHVQCFYTLYMNVHISSSVQGCDTVLYSWGVYRHFNVKENISTNKISWRQNHVNHLWKFLKIIKTSSKHRNFQKCANIDKTIMRETFKINGWENKNHETFLSRTLVWDVRVIGIWRFLIMKTSGVWHTDERIQTCCCHDNNKRMLLVLALRSCVSDVTGHMVEPESSCSNVLFSKVLKENPMLSLVEPSAAVKGTCTHVYHQIYCSINSF